MNYAEGLFHLCYGCIEIKWFACVESIQIKLISIAEQHEKASFVMKMPLWIKLYVVQVHYFAWTVSNSFPLWARQGNKKIVKSYAI